MNSYVTSYKLEDYFQNETSVFFDEKANVDVDSLQRIKYVVHYLLEENNSIYDFCEKNKLDLSSFLSWKKSFEQAFKAYSEDKKELKNQAKILKKKIVLGSNEKAYSFLRKYLNISPFKNLVLEKGQKLSSSSSINKIKNIIVLEKLNNFRKINKQLEEYNSKLSNGEHLIGCFETFNSRPKNTFQKLPVIGKLYDAFEFLFKRVFPKLPYINKLYLFITKGKNRLLSKAEALGRLVSCGFDIVDFKSIDGVYYFVAKKVSEPSFDMNPSYGPLFKMRRVGKDGKIIGVYKFRTMHPYSEYLQDYIVKLNGYSESGKPANDFRIVPWAKFLRKYWLDELPQLINLFKGDLKLVGARPVSLGYFKEIPKDIQDLRLTQKPGCIPPYVALNRKSSVESVLSAEREYLLEKQKNPYTTDTKFFFNAISNIFFKGKRSA